MQNFFHESYSRQKQDYLGRQARLIRAIRKEAGMNQREMAKVLSVSQSQLHRFETGRASIDSVRFAHLCETFGIEFNSIGTGCYDRWPGVVPSFGEAGFDLDQEYLSNPFSTGRTVASFVQALDRSLGVAQSDEALRALGIDPDFLCNLSHQISLLAILKTADFLIGRGYLQQKTMPLLTVNFGKSWFHPWLKGQLHFDSASDLQAGCCEWIRNLHTFERNYKYLIEMEKPGYFLFSRKPNSHINQKALTESQWLCAYIESTIHSFTSGMSRGRCRAHVSEIECTHRGFPRCLYRVSFYEI